MYKMACISQMKNRIIDSHEQDPFKSVGGKES